MLTVLQVAVIRAPVPEYPKTQTISVAGYTQFMMRISKSHNYYYCVAKNTCVGKEHLEVEDGYTATHQVKTGVALT